MSKQSSGKGKKDAQRDLRKTQIMPTEDMEGEDEVFDWEDVSSPAPTSSNEAGDRVNRQDRADFNQTLIDGKLPGGVEQRRKDLRRSRGRGQKDNPSPRPRKKPKPKEQRPSAAPPGIRHRSAPPPTPTPKPRPRTAPTPQERVAITLSPGSVRLDPGETEQITINLQNMGPVHGNFAIKVKCPTEGIRTELSQNLVSMAQGARATVGLTIHAPKSSTVVAGQHDFQVLVGSNQTRKRVGMTEGRITVTPYERFSFSVQPAKVKNNQSAQITINNEGNAPVRYRISGRDQTAAIDFDILEPVIEIDPGDSQTLLTTISTQSQVWFGKEERLPFEVRVATTAGEKKTERGTLLVPPRIPYLYAGIAAGLFIIMLVAFIASRGAPTLSTTQADVICNNIRWLPKDVKNIVVPACRQLRRAEALGSDIDQAKNDLGIDSGATTTTGEQTTTTGDTTNNNGTGESEVVLTAPTTDGGEATDSAETPSDTEGVTVVDTSGDNGSTGTQLAAVDWAVESAELGGASGGTQLASTQLGNGPNAIVLIGGIHSGYAPGTVQVANQLIQHFTDNPTEIPANSTLHILPNFNPDGKAAVGDRSGRFNSNGVDLNRNFDCNWTSNAVVLGQAISGSGGTSPLSEPEALAIERWMVDVQPRAVIVLGAAAPSPEIAAGGCNGATQASTNLAQTFAGASGYFVDSSGSVTGDITDWLANRDIPSIFILMSTLDGTQDYSSILQGLKVVLDVYQ